MAGISDAVNRLTSTERIKGSLKRGLNPNRFAADKQATREAGKDIGILFSGEPPDTSPEEAAPTLKSAESRQQEASANRRRSVLSRRRTEDEDQRTSLFGS